MTPRFRLGELLTTPGAQERIGLSGQVPTDFLTRHIRGDWGGLEVADREANDAAVRNGGRLFSQYKTLFGDTVWIITDADRSRTTILLPNESSPTKESAMPP